MNFDLILLLLVLAAFGLLIGRRVFERRRTQDDIDRLMASRRTSRVRGLARLLVVATLAAFVLHAFVIEPFRVNSGSMLPSLQVDDFVLVNKSAYGLRLPFSGSRLLATGMPQRGDVAVFHHPQDEGAVSVKRVVGLPGDRVVYRDKRLTINGVPVPLNDLGTFAGRGVTRYLDGARLAEEVVGERMYRVLLMPDAVVPADDFQLSIPDGFYFVLGDNRDNSQDSRDWGLVPAANLIGRVFFTVRFRASS